LGKGGNDDASKKKSRKTRRELISAAVEKKLEEKKKESENSQKADQDMKNYIMSLFNVINPTNSTPRTNTSTPISSSSGSFQPPAILPPQPPAVQKITLQSILKRANNSK